MFAVHRVEREHEIKQLKDHGAVYENYERDTERDQMDVIYTNGVFREVYFKSDDGEEYRNNEYAGENYRGER